MSEVYAFIEAEKSTHPVALLCRLLKVARSSFYAWLVGEKTRRAKQAADDVLAHEITGFVHRFRQQLFSASGGTRAAACSMFTRSGSGSLSVEG
jgi:hypothetical protein